MTQRIDIIDYSVQPPERLASWWWSDERGLTCDNPRAVDLLAGEGITLRGGEHTIYPRHGYAFFAALILRYSGLVRATLPQADETQGGEPVTP